MAKSRGLGGMVAGLAIGLVTGWLSWGEGVASAQEWIGSARTQNSVLVISVETEQRLADVRQAVKQQRVVASSEAGFALESQGVERVVVRSLESAGEILAMAGWQDRPLEIVAIGRRVRSVDDSDSKTDQATRIATLANKPTLTRGEAYLVLKSL